MDAQRGRYRTRPAGVADAEPIAVAHVEGWQVGYRGLIPDEALAEIDVDQRADRWRQLLAAGTVMGLVVESSAQNGAESGEVVGFSIFGPVQDDPDADASDGIISAFYLRPVAWGTGAAATLMGATERRLLEEGYLRARLNVLSGNARARRFYRKAGWVTNDHGFVHESRQPGMTRPVTVRAVTFTKPLGLHEAWPLVREELAAVHSTDLRLASMAPGGGGVLCASVELDGQEWLFLSVPAEANLADRVAALADQVQDFVVEDLPRQNRSTAWPECPDHPNRHPLGAGVEGDHAVWRCPTTGSVVREIGRPAPTTRTGARRARAHRPNRG